MSERYPLPAKLNRLQSVSLIIGIIGLILGAIGFFTNPSSFYNSYLFSYFFWIGIPIGSLAIIMMHHLTHGYWGAAVRRQCEAAALTLPLLLILFIPICFGLKYLFPWGIPSMVAHDPILQQQSRYFNTTWFIIRAAIYFVVLLLMTFSLCRNSIGYERDGDHRRVSRMQVLSGPGLVILTAIITLLSIDLVMAREAHFYSTVIGFLIAMGQSLSAVVFAVALLLLLGDQSDQAPYVTKPVLIDLGNMILMFVILWAYMNLSQLLIIWMGNITDESTWYIHRGGLSGTAPNVWKYVGMILVILHFFVPFFILLSRKAKQSVKFLGGLALVVLIMRVVDSYWLIAPSGPRNLAGKSSVSWMDIPLLLGIGGIWFFCFVALLRRRPVIAREELNPAEAAARKLLDQARHKHVEHGGAAGASPA